MSGRLFLFAGGGTGGHLAPGMAVAAELRRREPDCRIRFIGSGRPVEQQMLSDTGYEHVAHPVLPLSRIKRRPIQMLASHWNAYRHERASIRRDTPAAVIGLGGYASAAVVMAAGREKVPVLLLEQNAIPGRANRLLARWFPICLTFEQSRRHLPGRATAHITGNPIRPEITATNDTVAQPANSPTLTLLILGGSQGSQEVNESVVFAVQELGQEVFSNWQIVHQTGADGEASTRSAYAQLRIDHVVQPFFDDLSSWYAQSALCIGRAGATTLTELAIAGVPAILIPYRHAADDHQTENARLFVEAGAAVLASGFHGPHSSRGLIDSLKDLLSNSQRRTDMAAGMRSLAKPNAAAQVVDLLPAVS